jgi:hypothetical protein
MYPYGEGKESFTQGSAILPEDGSRTGCRNFVFFYLNGRQCPPPPIKERDFANVTFSLYIHALHEIEFLTDASSLQETSRRHIPVTAI